MSLKAFHIFFVAISTLLALGYGGWAVQRYLAALGGGYLWLAIGCALAAVVFVVYGIWFLRKFRDVSFL